MRSPPPAGSDVFACPAVAAAIRLADWVGDGRAVTPAGALKPPLVPLAAAALGMTSPPKVRRLADVPAVHRPWIVAMAIGAVTIRGSRAVVAPLDGVDDADWLRALEQVLDEQIIDQCDADPRILSNVVLTLLDKDLSPLGEGLRREAERMMRDRGDWDWRAAGLLPDSHPVGKVLTALHDFAAIDRSSNLTRLGHLARTELGRRIPAAITPDTPATAVLCAMAALPDEEGIWQVAERWLDSAGWDLTARSARLRDLLLAAADAEPAGRVAAVEIIAERGEYALPLWREAERHSALAPHARHAIAQLERGDTAAPDDLRWITTDYAAAALDRRGTTDAWYAILDGHDLTTGTDPTDILRATGHPDAIRLLDAFTPDPPAVRVQQLKISLRAGCWRRVLVPEHLTLGDLHETIRVLFGWGDDHLHLFRTRRRSYSDPFHHLDDTGDEYARRLNHALPEPGSKITYIYDLGDCWTHEILLESVQELPPAHPVCTAGRGDNPIEHYHPDYPEDPIPFDQDTINKQLQSLFA